MSPAFWHHFCLHSTEPITVIRHRWNSESEQADTWLVS